MARILITGGNGAFGILTAKAALNAGHEVAVTMRDPLGRNTEASAALGAIGAEVIEIDVTSDHSVDRGVKEALEVLGGIDVLVNVAGTGSHGIAEGFTSDQMIGLFDINVFGIHRMMRAVLPTMRQQGKGLVINLSSLLGRLSLPFYGPYSAAKFAVESLSDSYRVEVSQFGVDVVLVEPGGFPTSWIDNLVHPRDGDVLKSYGGFADIPEQALKDYRAFLATKPEQKPEKVARAIMNLINLPVGERPARTIVDFIGIGEAVSTMNDVLASTTHAVYQSFGMETMLKLKI